MSARTTTARLRERIDVLADRALTRLARVRRRVPTVDVAMAVYERDKDAAGTLLGSALALRLFLFFVPLSLLFVGVAGIVGKYVDVGSPASVAGYTGTLAAEVDRAFDQSGSAPWIAATVGLVGILTTGRSLTRALLLSSAVSWRLGGRQRTPIRAIGVVVGIVVGMVLVASVINRIRSAAGVAVASVSFVAVLAVYVVLWAALYLALPRGTSDPGAVLPGATLVAVVLTGLQAITQLYLPRQIESASSLYGAVGVAIALLGWFFIVGRALALSFSVNAVLYARIGSVSTFVFGLPGLRLIPRRIPSLGRYFALDGHDRGSDPPP